MKEPNVRYQNQGDYQLPCITTKEQNELHIGVWANRHRQYLKQHHRIKYYNLLTSEKLYPYNSVFVYLLAQKKGESNLNQEKLLKSTIESSKKRISDLDKLFSRIYEDNIIGKLSDERYSRMADEYESEQKELAVKVAECEKQLVELQKQTVDMKMLYQGLSEFTEMKELTPLVVNKLIERIEIHNNEKKHSHNKVKVDIYFTAIGLFDVPTEQELLKTAEEIKNRKQLTDKSA